MAETTEKHLDNVFTKIDQLKPEFVKRLAHAVSIPSVSAEEERRPEVVKMGKFLASELTKLGAQVELRELGPQPGKPNLNLPPVVLARHGNDSSKRTILIYGHYDVQPAFLEDGWNSEPFKLVEDGDKLLGRGSTDDKGPVLGWLNVIQAHREAGIELPVNLLFCFEGMEEYGSEGLDDLIVAEKDKFFKSTDAVCISDNYWLGTEQPVLTYGLRGVSYYSVTVKGPAADLHSGVFGGTVAEPMTDLVRVMANLVDSQGRIQIPGVMEMVAPVTDEEEGLYDSINYKVDDLQSAIGAKTNYYNNTKETLMARWRFPSLSLHGIEGAFSQSGAKTVIPAKVSGKFSIRTVPNITPKELDEVVFDYVKSEFARLKSPNQMSVECIHAGNWWLSSPKHWNFRAAEQATKRIWGVEPDFTREGGSIPVTLTFEQALKKNVLLLPMGRGDDGAHSINEKLNLSNYIQGIKTMSAYLHYVSTIPTDN